MHQILAEVLTKYYIFRPTNRRLNEYLIGSRFWVLGKSRERAYPKNHQNLTLREGLCPICRGSFLDRFDPSSPLPILMRC